MIKAVLIDVDDTVLDFCECAGQSIKYACNDLSISYSDDIKTLFLDVNDILWQRVEKGEITRDYLHDVRFDMVFERLNIKADGRAFEKVFRSYLNVSHIPVNGAEELLDYLSHKYYLAVASNAFYTQQIERLGRAGFLEYFKHIFVSSEAKADKPSKAFFDYCVKNLPVEDKSEVIMIGDSLTADIYGGVEYGIKTCYFNRKGRTPKEDCKPDFTVTDLAEIKNIL